MLLAAAAVLAARPGCGESGAFDPALVPYVEMARRGDCADRVNRLYWIDLQLVLWRREGACADAAWLDALYDGTSLDALCTAGDSIAGPRQSCQDAGALALFQTIEDHSTAEDLGLRPGHTVELVFGR
jgi:hypothetical protein